MKQQRIYKVAPVFIDYIPPYEKLRDGKLYVSIQYNIAVHRCMCGCGSEIATPISPRGWTMTYNGEEISLSPSIGNWSYPCRSHYFIRNNRVEWLSGDVIMVQKSYEKQESKFIKWVKGWITKK